MLLYLNRSLKTGSDSLAAICTCRLLSQSMSEVEAVCVIFVNCCFEIIENYE